MPISDESLNIRNFVPASTPSSIDNMLSYSVLIQCAFVGTKAELSITAAAQVRSTLDVVDIQRSGSHAETGTREAKGAGRLRASKRGAGKVDTIGPPQPSASAESVNPYDLP